MLAGAPQFSTSAPKKLQPTHLNFTSQLTHSTALTIPFITYHRHSRKTYAHGIYEWRQCAVADDTVSRDHVLLVDALCSLTTSVRSRYSMPLANKTSLYMRAHPWCDIARYDHMLSHILLQYEVPCTKPWTARLSSDSPLLRHRPLLDAHDPSQGIQPQQLCARQRYGHRPLH